MPSRKKLPARSAVIFRSYSRIDRASMMWKWRTVLSGYRQHQRVTTRLILSSKAKKILMQTTSHNIAALDVGEKRVGIAMTNTLARLPHPLITLNRGDTFWDELEKLLTHESI